MIYSDQNVTLNILQGVSDRTGALVYRTTKSIPVPATVATTFDEKVFGKFASVDIVNAAGVPANVEIFASSRAYNLSAGSVIQACSKWIRIPIALAASYSSLTFIPANAVVVNAWLDVVAAYTPGTTITIGNAASPALLQNVLDNNPVLVGLHRKAQNTGWGAIPATVLVTIAGGPVAGSGFVLVEYVEVPGL
jgi:hypothetical protein